VTEAVKASGVPAAGRPAFSAGYRTWLLFLLALIYTSNFVDRTLLSTLAQLIKQDLHLSDTDLGLLTGTAFAVLYAVLGIPLARLIEHKSRIVVMSVCIAIWSVMTAACGLAQSFVQLALPRIGVGIGEAGCQPAAHSLISDHFPPEKRATALAIFGLGIPVGTLIGAIGGGWIAQTLGWRSAFVWVGAPGLILALLALVTLKEPPRGHAEGADGQATAPPLTAVIRRYFERPSTLWVIAGATVAATAAYAILAFTSALFVRRYGLNIREAALAFGAISGVGAGVSILGGGVLADRLAKTDVRAYAWVSVAGLLLAIPLFALGFTRPDWVSALALLVPAAAAQQLYLAPTFAIANNMVEPRMRATSIALFSTCWSLVGIGFGPLAAGVISDAMAKALKADPAGTDVLHLCRQAGCADASATGLQYALASIVVLYLIAALLFAASSGTMKRDLAKARAAVTG
jgi:predicted MFS family arabinose efflux permease